MKIIPVLPAHKTFPPATFYLADQWMNRDNQEALQLEAGIIATCLPGGPTVVGAVVGQVGGADGQQGEVELPGHRHHRLPQFQGLGGSGGPHGQDLGVGKEISPWGAAPQWCCPRGILRPG